MTYRSHEFLYVDGSYKKEYSDFTENDAFSNEERKEFILHYGEYLHKWYGLPDESLYAADPEAAKALVEELDARPISPRITREELLKTVEAELIPAPEAYRNWQFYTKKLSVQDGALVFPHDDHPPTPSAVYYVDPADRVRVFAFDFYLDGKHRAVIKDRVRDITSKRHVDIRSGNEDLLRVGFYATGECYAFVMNETIYHAPMQLIGHFEFDKWQSCKIYVGDSTFSVEINGVRSEEYALGTLKNPDRIFIASGMFHVGNWMLRPLALTTENGTATEFFLPAEKTVEVSEKIGTVSLPYVVGGYKNRDKMLRLTTAVHLSSGYTNKLLFDSLDPGGRVYLDGSLVAAVDGFDSFEVDLTSFADGGDHTLCIEVDPRAPELLFTWHRHRDPYNGWFCERVRLVQEKEISFSDLRAVTRRVENGEADVILTGHVNAPVTVKVYMTNIWPQVGEEHEIATFAAEGDFSQAYTLSVKAWTPDTPELYALRFVAVFGEKEAADAVLETGFRTICQRGGRIYLNGEHLVLKGMLMMQYMPPYEDIPTYHICMRSDQIAWQYQMLKGMNGNTMRIHNHGYGTNDERLARYADRMGVMLIWITRYIDSLEQLDWDEHWQVADAYITQMKARINHPSIIMWEGANEFHPSLGEIDKIYNEFVGAVKPVDDTRLLCPISHLYYVPMEGCECYKTDGTEDYFGNPVKAPASWNDELVVRSAHPYGDFLGYGEGWCPMRLLEHEDRRAMMESDRVAYMVSEFAIIGRQDPRTPEAQRFINRNSYELWNEDCLGFRFTDEEWHASQAWQALAVHHSVKQLRYHDVDGMLWCCLMGGANDASYLKPTIDNYGYAKLAFYTMREGFSPVQVALADIDTKKKADFDVKAVLYGREDASYRVEAVIKREDGTVLCEHDYGTVVCTRGLLPLPTWNSGIGENGYFTIEFSATEV